MEPHSPGPERNDHAPQPSLWPVGFAIGIAVLLTGLAVDDRWIVTGIGGAITLVFGFLWLRDLAAGEDTVPQPTPAAAAGPGAAPAQPGEAALPRASEEEVDRFPRSRFLEFATLGLGGAIGGLITLPVAGFAVLPTFIGQEPEDVDVGPLDAFPEGSWRVVTFMQDPEAGEVSRRTAFVRYNGLLEGAPSFTVLSNRCVHLGCPVQPSGEVDEENAEEEMADGELLVRRIPTNPAAFACPCHGGAYDQEGNRTSGPPVRALDRYEFAVRNGRLFLRTTYSVGEVRPNGDGEYGKFATIVKYGVVPPGIHVDGPQQVLYPVNPPR